MNSTTEFEANSADKDTVGHGRSTTPHTKGRAAGSDRQRGKGHMALHPRGFTGIFRNLPAEEQQDHTAMDYMS